MSTCSRSWGLTLSLGSCLLVGCFSPSGSAGSGQPTGTDTTGPTGDSEPTLSAPSTTTDGPPTSTSGDPTGETTTGDPTIGPSTTSVTATTHDDCGVCPESTPFCGSGGQCIGCTGLAAEGTSCADLDPTKPFCDGGGGCVGCNAENPCADGVCHPDLGVCVECFTAGDCPEKAACDEQTHTCSTCSEHSDCPGSACELDKSICFPEDSAQWYVGPAGQCGAKSCEFGQPCCDLADAMNLLTASPATHHIIHLAPGSYASTLALTSAKRLAVFGAPGTTIATATGGDPLIFVGDLMGANMIDAKLFLSRLKLSGAGPVAFRCYQAVAAWLDDVELRDFDGASIDADKCHLTARRSRFIHNNSGIEIGSEALVSLENDVISNMTIGPSLTVQIGGALEATYITVAQQNPVSAGLLSCPGAGSVFIRNSALLSDQMGQYIDCVAVPVLERSIVSDDLLVDVPGVVELEPDQVAQQFSDWFLDYLVPFPRSALAGVALWTAGDPKTDIDGLARPAVDPSPDYAGAHLP